MEWARTWTWASAQATNSPFRQIQSVAVSLYMGFLGLAFRSRRDAVTSPSEQSHLPSYRSDQLLRVVSDALLEPQLHLSPVFDPHRRIAGDHDQIRLLPCHDRAGSLRGK